MNCDRKSILTTVKKLESIVLLCYPLDLNKFDRIGINISLELLYSVHFYMIKQRTLQIKTYFKTFDSNFFLK